MGVPPDGQALKGAAGSSFLLRQPLPPIGLSGLEGKEGGVACPPQASRPGLFPVAPSGLTIVPDARLAPTSKGAGSATRCPFGLNRLEIRLPPQRLTDYPMIAHPGLTKGMAMAILPLGFGAGYGCLWTGFGR